MFRVLKHASRIPLFLHKKSNHHIFTIWQHIVLIVLRQYENKSYRMFVEWLIEAYYLRIFMKLSHISPHYTTLQKFTERINGTSLLWKIISSFILFLNINRLFTGIRDSSGFKTTNASQYYTYKAKIPKKYVKLSVSADMLFQLICTIKIRRAPTKHDIIDFPPLVIKASEILPISVTVADKGYDSEDNHVLVRDYVHALSIIPPRYQSVALWRTYGR